MKKILFIFCMLSGYTTIAQDLNWNSASYTAESLTHNFGTIGIPASSVQMTISGPTSLFENGSPYKYRASGFANCSQICGMREVVFFTALGQVITHKFTFSPGVSGLSFSIYDIDYSNPGDVTYDLVKITATDGTSNKNISVNDVDAFTTITGNGTTAPIIRGEVSGIDNRVNITIAEFVTELTITFELDPASTTIGDKSITIGNMNWFGVLPVKMGSVNARSLGNGANQISWNTLDETDLDHFFIEKSKDGIAFNKIGTQAKNTAANNNQYSFTDLFATGGIEYYRVGMVDKTGAVKYSIVVRVNGQAKTETVTLMPNPAQNFINLQSTGSSKIISAGIYNSLGVKVQETGLANSNTINIKNLKPGIYLIKFNKEDGGFVTKGFLKE